MQQHEGIGYMLNYIPHCEDVEFLLKRQVGKRALYNVEIALPAQPHRRCGHINALNGITTLLSEGNKVSIAAYHVEDPSARRYHHLKVSLQYSIESLHENGISRKSRVRVSIQLFDEDHRLIVYGAEAMVA